jgi:hypothetical protein
MISATIKSVQVIVFTNSYMCDETRISVLKVAHRTKSHLNWLLDQIHNVAYNSFQSKN